MASHSKRRKSSHPKQLRVALLRELRQRFGADQVLPQLLENDCGLVLGELCRDLGYPDFRPCTLFSLSYLAALFLLKGKQPPHALVGEQGVLSRLNALSPMPRKVLCCKLFPNEFALLRHPQQTSYTPSFFWSDQRCPRGVAKLGKRSLRVWRSSYQGMRLCGRVRVALKEAYHASL